ncbi:hypothetical protein [Candidatus Magnetobacterium casense]|uniref:Uncharacterized protein n=1 Tax=Candidatus Magnetobacterium casense TaxID=1455061 RepID=A0ABS6RVD5_9BACT|nr:hypothetical protein [Candidatus Magnetobacterium casensis]MBV6340587.1 hypothetical protein [Candidatus Magnetobacterium casensis]
MGTETLSPEMTSTIKQLILDTLKEMSMQAPDNLTLLFFQLSKEFGDFKREVELRFDKVDERFDKVDERFDKVDERFDKVDERFDKVDERFAKVDERFDKIEREMVTKDYLKEALTDFAAQIGVGVRKIVKEEMKQALSEQ